MEGVATSIATKIPRIAAPDIRAITVRSLQTGQARYIVVPFFQLDPAPKDGLPHFGLI
jgi:hypothetical protein